MGKSTMSTPFSSCLSREIFRNGHSRTGHAFYRSRAGGRGKIPFVSSFAVFVTGRAYDQIRQTIAIGKLNVKICGSSAGFSDYGDGSTHQAVEDVAIMNAIPNMTILTPCDAQETRQAVRAAVEIKGPVYIRVGRNDIPDFIKPEDTFKLGKMRVLKEGRGSPFCLRHHGRICHESR